MRIVVIGNPQNRRVAFFSEAARQLNLPTPIVVSYLDLLRNKVKLSDWLDPGTLLRIESPGENFEVEKELIALGANIGEEIITAGNTQQITARDALHLEYDYGRIRYLRQWYQGFDQFLSSLKNEVESVSSIRWMNTPDAIRILFDKNQCQQLLTSAGIPTPRTIRNISTYEELKQQLNTRKLQRVFIKPSHSSSATGVIAYRYHLQREEAITTIEMEGSNEQKRFYNSLKIKRYTSSIDIAAIIDFILNEGAIVEEWIPKATLQKQTFDVRVVVINGKSFHILPRLSSGPITNLHLGNQRGDLYQLTQTLGIKKYDQLLYTAEQGVKQIPGAFYAGVDLLIPMGWGKPRILEINAFGDLLPNWLHQKEDTYTTELKALMNV